MLITAKELKLFTNEADDKELKHSSIMPPLYQEQKQINNAYLDNFDQ